MIEKQKEKTTNERTNERTKKKSTAQVVGTPSTTNRQTKLTVRKKIIVAVRRV